MVDRLKFYIDGAWTAPAAGKTIPVVNPATEEVLYEVALGGAADVDKAVAAARRAFESYSMSSREDRIALLQRVIEVYKSRMKEIGAAISDEMGAPLPFAERAQAGAGLGHLMTTLEVLKTYPFEERLGSAMLLREPVGVAGMITPWNWPLNQIACKVAPALAAGCTMLMKPSEYTPTSALIFAEVLHEAGVPAGVFNLVNGLGLDVGAPMASHPGLDMISFTGSTRAGIDVAQRAAPTVKRVTQELGGKSANIILEDADFEKAIGGGAAQCFMNSGQSCNAPTRMLVPMSRMEEAAAIAKATAEKTKTGDPREGRHGYRPGRQPDAVGENPGAHREGHPGRRHARGRRSRPPGGPQQGLLRAANRVRQRHQRYDHSARGDIRPRPVDRRLQGRGGRDPHRQRYALRPCRLRLLRRYRAGTPGLAPHPRR